MSLELISVGVVGIILGYLLARPRAHERLTLLVNEERHLEKEKRKRVLLRHLRLRGRITNNEVEELLGVSDATATRYFDELEAEGKIVQKGTGRETFYELSPEV